MSDELTASVETIIMLSLKEVSAEAIELRIRRRGKTVMINILADKPEGGITIEECGRINRKVTQAIEGRRWFGGDYTVEVSSPGLDRPLATASDFTRARGRNVQCRLTGPVGGKGEYAGKIDKVEDGKIHINKNGKTVIIPLSCISTAVQIIE